MREGDVHSQVLSSSLGVTSPRARSVADLPAECLHNGFHANSSNRQRTHSGLSSPFGIQPRKHSSAEGDGLGVWVDIVTMSSPNVYKILPLWEPYTCPLKGN